jgi:hypothetical protein
MPTVFDTSHIAVQVDRYSGDIRENCSNDACMRSAEFQARRDDVYDGFWRQACSVHLASAVRVVGRLAHNAQPYGPLQVRQLAVHVSTCGYFGEPGMPPGYCCRNLESFS